ncbi:MAG: helix-turn-helix transcriptional regulator [Bacilli bacterium]|nr:helix-turn-helix transcriptional regulator [Bacilli bacterium]MDD4644152.1 helix-turn-helix transcriptional regulator [Bacilli bacterium]
MARLEKLQSFRLKENYTHQDMANCLNISKSFYWQLENKKRTLTYKMAIKIADIFNKKPDELFYDELKNKED